MIKWMKFADDLAMMAHSQEGLHRMVVRLNMISTEYDVKLNTKKTNVMKISRMEESAVKITTSEEDIKQVKKFCYLGSVVTQDANAIWKQKEEMWIWRRIEKVSWKEHKSNAEILKMVEERSVIKTIRERQRKWMGHVMRGDSLRADEKKRETSSRGQWKGKATRKTKNDAAGLGDRDKWLHMNLTEGREPKEEDMHIICMCLCIYAFI